jgi:serine/threonine-protein kinase
MDQASSPGGVEANRVIAGRYRLERVLGTGGMGAVHLAEHLGTGRKVALKLLLPGLANNADALARFQLEARAAATIDHPGVVEVLDTGTDEAGVFLVMEYLQGESLGQRLARGTLTLEEVGNVFGQVLEILAAAHDKGVLHRDLKPDNVFLVRPSVSASSPSGATGPRVKLLDFGLAKFTTSESPSKTASGVVMGTPLYMSPEQARSSKDLTSASDLYSVGAMLHQALSGEPPFGGESYGEVIVKVLTEPYVPLAQRRPDLPGGLAQLIDTLLTRQVADRPGDARTVRAALLATLDQSADVSNTHRRPTQPPTVGELPPGLSANAQVPGKALKSAPTIPATPSSKALGKPASRKTPRRGAIALVGVLASLSLVAILIKLVLFPGKLVTHAKPGTVRVEAKSGLEFVFIPGGELMYGCIGNDPRCNARLEKPHTGVTQPSFWIGKTDVTVKAFETCAAAGACNASLLTREYPNLPAGVCNWKEGRLDHPMNCLSWNEAEAFCVWVGGQLPTSEQWEFAARSGKNNIYPWGDQPVGPELTNYCDVQCPKMMTQKDEKRAEEAGSVDTDHDDGYAGTSPVGAFPKGATEWGLLDMAGNVAQWTRTDFPVERDDTQILKEIRGGSFMNAPVMLRTTDRRGRAAEVRFGAVGFRCVKRNF